MPTLFLNRPGQAVALPGDAGDQGMPLAIDGMRGSWFPRFTSILTEASLALDGNYQFSHTCKDIVYAYVFGRRISALRVSGLAFADRCPGGGFTGVEQVVGWYNANSIAARATPIQIQVGTGGSGRFRGFLTNLRAEIIRPENRISQFALMFSVFPG